MTRYSQSSAAPTHRACIVISAVVALGLVLFAAANAHLIYVAVVSQPACVDHLETLGNAPGVYRAAKSSC